MPGASTEQPARRPYESPVRQRQVDATRERILVAALTIVHALPTGDWRELTFRAVAERASTSERTVYRYFPTVRELHNAIVRRLEDEASATAGSMSLDELAGMAIRIFNDYGVHLPAERSLPQVRSARVRSIRASVSREASGWPDREQEMATAMLDVLLGLPSYERLVEAGHLDADHAAEAVQWVIGLVVDAIRTGQRPGQPVVPSVEERR